MPAPGGDRRLYRALDAVDGVPDGLAGALDALAADHKLVAAVGSALVENHIFVKRHEIEKTGSLEGNSLRDFYIYYV